VDTLFGIESQIAKAEWAIEPSELQQQEPSSAVISQGTAVSSVIAPAAPQAAASAPAPPLVGLTKSMADALLKKLSRMTPPPPLPFDFMPGPSLASLRVEDNHRDQRPTEEFASKDRTLVVRE
jgi:hypothetical protein